jgi:hypothetical protein
MGFEIKRTELYYIVRCSLVVYDDRMMIMQRRY